MRSMGTVVGAWETGAHVIERRVLTGRRTSAEEAGCPQRTRGPCMGQEVGKK